MNIEGGVYLSKFKLFENPLRVKENGLITITLYSLEDHKCIMKVFAVNV